MQKVRIYRMAKSATQSGPGVGRHWILQFEPRTPRGIDPLMGWVTSRDTTQQVRLRFDNKDEAIAYAQRHGYEFEVLEDQVRREIKPKSYADNFRYDRVI